MTKSDLIEAIAKKTGLSKTDAGASLDAFIDTVKSTLRKKDTVTLVGFGAFSVTRRKARTARNPRTGEAVKVKAQNAPKFKAGKALKDAVN